MLRLNLKGYHLAWKVSGRLPDSGENRKGVSQGRHIHALLSRGYETLLKYFPNMKTALEAAR